MKRKIKISPKPSINEALRSELAAQNKAKKNYIVDFNDWDDDPYYFLNEGITDDSFYDDDKDDYQVPTDKQPKEIYFSELMGDISIFDEKNDDYSTFSKSYISETFSNVDELKTYCLLNGIYIPKNELTSIRYRKISYCTFDPDEKSRGELVLVSDNSWGGLYWTVNDIADAIKQDKKITTK